MFILLSLMIIFLIYGCGFIYIFYIFVSNEKSEKVTDYEFLIHSLLFFIQFKF